MNHQIHVLHRNNTKQNLISHDDRASKSDSILESYFHGPTYGIILLLPSARVTSFDRTL